VWNRANCRYNSGSSRIGAMYDVHTYFAARERDRAEIRRSIGIDIPCKRSFARCTNGVRRRLICRTASGSKESANSVRMIYGKSVHRFSLLGSNEITTLHSYSCHWLDFCFAKYLEEHRLGIVKGSGSVIRNLNFLLHAHRERDIVRS